jgi:hypothetical protein
MDPSSEFRPVVQLDGIFSEHPNYKFVRDMVEGGMDCIFITDLDEDQHIHEMEPNLTRGDHKSATNHQDIKIISSVSWTEMSTMDSRCQYQSVQSTN